LLVWIKISQRIKILIDLKTLSEKAFSNFLLVLLEELLRENERTQNTIFSSFIQTYVSCQQKK
jgi:hypothetical protein